MRDATIITPDKNKGDRSEYNNYQGISLKSIVSKVFFRVLLTRLHAHPHHRVYLWLHNQSQENQCECAVPKPLKSKSATTLSR